MAGAKTLNERFSSASNFAAAWRRMMQRLHDWSAMNIATDFADERLCVSVLTDKKLFTAWAVDSACADDY